VDESPDEVVPVEPEKGWSWGEWSILVLVVLIVVAIVLFLNSTHTFW